jgi:glutaredoxin 3
MTKRKVEIFSAGCAMCEDAIELVKKLACPACDVEVLDMHNHEVSKRAKSLGIKTVPAIVVDGRLASCCSGKGPTESDLRAAGVGQPL